MAAFTGSEGACNTAYCDVSLRRAGARSGYRRKSAGLWRLGVSIAVPRFHGGAGSSRRVASLDVRGGPPRRTGSQSALITASGDQTHPSGQRLREILATPPRPALVGKRPDRGMATVTAGAFRTDTTQSLRFPPPSNAGTSRPRRAGPSRRGVFGRPEVSDRPGAAGAPG